MSTRSEIIRISDAMIRDKGINAFSFYDVSKELGIKNASIHYHFPTKTDLCIAVIDGQIAGLEVLIAEAAGKDPAEQLKTYLSIYTKTKAEDKVCIVGSLAPDLHTVDAAIKDHLKILVDKILNWVTDILKEGRDKGIFHFSAAPRTRALMIITNMLASLALTRLTGDRDFNTIKDTIIKELKA